MKGMREISDLLVGNPRTAFTLTELAAVAECSKSQVRGAVLAARDAGLVWIRRRHDGNNTMIVQLRITKKRQKKHALNC